MLKAIAYDPRMRSLRPVTTLLVAALALAAPQAQALRIVIAVGTALDGRGGLLRDTRLVIQDGRIAAIDPTAAPIDYDLRTRTVSPGWIDTHVHPVSYTHLTLPTNRAV